MAGSFWRLLVAFLLILFAALVQGQNAGDDAPLSINPERLRYAPASALDTMLPSEPLGASVLSSGPRIIRDPPASGPIGFLQIAAPAGIIFSGAVTAVSRASPKGPYATTITFKVNQAIRGALAGQTLTIREWAGLWSRGERYRVGERVFLFLYGPSRLGLTSPVAGGTGRFAVDVKGKILLNPQHVQIFANDPILGGKIAGSFDDFARAVKRAGLE